MTVTLSMWLGVAFLALAIIATLLQAWLWNPKYWDDVAKKSHAPPAWMFVHRACGYAYAGIYVVMMWYMVPRLWEYQVELPARTIIHAVAAITIGVVLLTKILIIRFFRYFEEAMPVLGMVLLVCTVILATLSLPFAFRAHGSAEVMSDDNRQRVHRILSELELGEGFTADGLTSVEALSMGREIVVRKCTGCHDLRTILVEPRTGRGWLSVCRRMQDKPTFGAPLTDLDVMLSTAYLIAITPGIQDDAHRRRADAREREDVAASLGELDLEEGSSGGDAEPPPPPQGEEEALQIEPSAADAGPPSAEAAPEAEAAPPRPTPARRSRRRRAARRDAGSASEPAVASTSPTAVTPAPTATRSPPTPPAPTPAPAPSAALSGSEIFSRRCLDCHGSEETREFGGADRSGWSRIVRQMIVEGAEITPEEARVLVSWLARRYPASE